MKVLQIATIGSNPESVSVGIRSLPLDKLNLICLDSEIEVAEEFRNNLLRVMRIPIDIFTISDHVIDEMLQVVSDIVSIEGKNFDDIILNVAGGNKDLACAATVAAFINGLKAYHVMGENLIMLPIMRLEFKEILSNSKKEILHNLASVDGEIESLTKLSQLSGYSKSLLSHHIFGSNSSRGLVSLGLVEVDRRSRGRLHMELTTLGRLAQRMLNN